MKCDTADMPKRKPKAKNHQRDENQLALENPLVFDVVQREMEKSRNITMKSLWKAVLNCLLALGPIVISIWITRSYGLPARRGKFVYLAAVCVIVALIFLWDSGMHGSNDPFRKRKKRG